MPYHPVVPRYWPGHPEEEVSVSDIFSDFSIPASKKNQEKFECYINFFTFLYLQGNLRKVRRLKTDDISRSLNLLVKLLCFNHQQLMDQPTPF